MLRETLIILALILLVPTLTTTLSAGFLAFSSARARQNIVKAKKDVEDNPGKNGPVFELMYLRLEAYLDANRGQNRSIYFWTILVILAGFMMIALGICAVILNIFPLSNYFGVKIVQAPPEVSLPLLVGGVITEFIAATILLVYRSVFLQTSEYFKALERFASIGMSIGILDDLADDATTQGLKTEAKIAIAKRLLVFKGLARSSHSDESSSD